MALQTPAYVISASSHSAELFRRAVQSNLMSTGVVGSLDLAVAQHATPNMSVDIAAGSAWIPGTYGSTAGYSGNWGAQTTFGLPASFNSQGSYYAYNDATSTLTIAAADPTNPRIDLVCATVQDQQYSGSNNQVILQVVTGTAAPSPTAPTAPASSLVLATVAVAAAASSIVTANITDQRVYAYSAPTVPLLYEASITARSGSGTTSSPGDVVYTVTVPNLPFGAMVQFYAHMNIGIATAGGEVSLGWFNGSTAVGPITNRYNNGPATTGVASSAVAWVFIGANSGSKTYTCNVWNVFNPGGYTVNNDATRNLGWGWAIPTSGV